MFAADEKRVAVPPEDDITSATEPVLEAVNSGSGKCLKRRF
jgi:hypothetical protein